MKATRVGVNSIPPKGQTPVITCARCGIQRKWKGGRREGVCRSCWLVLKDLNELEEWAS